MKILIALLLVTTQYLFALVSIVPIEIGDDAGVHGQITASLETKRGNTEKDTYKGSVKIVYDSNTSYVTWAEISGEYAEADKIVDTNKIYIHLRHIHALTPEDIRMEGFVQDEDDQFKNIKRRLLGGGGLRFKIFNIFKDGKGYIGLGSLYETIKYTDPLINKEEKNIRINSYFAYTAKLGDDSTISYSLFYQPKYNNFHDYVKSHKLNLELHVYKKLYLNLKASWDVDTKPAIGVKKYDLYQETSFVLKF
jgi:hypothetical protein